LKIACSNRTWHPEFFETERDRSKPADVIFYQVLIRQPLDENWMDFAGRLPHEEDADSYLGSWGVLAENENQAQQLVLQWQSRCYPIEAEIVELSGTDESFVDIPGVVWQGQRILPGDEDLNDLEGDEFDDDEFDDDDELSDEFDDK